MDIRTARPDDFPTLKQHDRHISSQELERGIQLGRVYVAEERGIFTGWVIPLSAGFCPPASSMN